MSSRLSTFISIAPHVIGGIAVITAAAYAGLWLGGRDAPTNAVEKRSSRNDSASAPVDASQQSPKNPQHFYAYLGWDRLPIADVVLEEARLAEAVGVDACIVPVNLPWLGHGLKYVDAFEPVRRIMDAAPETDVILDLRVAPPATWLAENPSARVADPDNSTEFASLAHERWRSDVASALRAAAEWLTVENTLPRVRGVVLRSDSIHAWGASMMLDKTESNTNAFRTWLASRTSSDAQLQELVESTGGIETVSVPDNSETVAPFERSLHVEYAKFAIRAVGDALQFLAAETKSAFGKQRAVYLPYGYSLGGADGHGALARLLDDKNVDGIFAPVSSTGRGVGGAGGFIGPVTAAAVRGKEWIHLDDTRTGLERNAERAAPTASVSEQVYHVQRRNFSAALIHGISYAPADPSGMGALLDSEMWGRFGSMRDVMGDHVNHFLVDGYGSSIGAISPLAVVVDEPSLAYLSDTSAVSTSLIEGVRDSVLRAGVPVRFCLLHDVLQGRADPAKAYLFLNAFELTAPDRLRLRRKLEREKATAIWMYAPGIIGPESAHENVSDIVGMNVRSFPSGATAGSKSALVSPWIEKDATFGESIALNSLFFIDDEDASTIALYRASDKVSAAIRFFGEDEEPDWTSVYIAEPTLPPGLLREVLQIAEVHVFVETTERPVQQTMHLGRGMMAVHAEEPGERLFDLGIQCSVEDVLNPARGWPPRRFLTVPMAGGETAIFRLKPEAKPAGGS